MTIEEIQKRIDDIKARAGDDESAHLAEAKLRADFINYVAESIKTEIDYDWHKAADKLPDMAVIVWVSRGGGTALLARYDRYRWESATSNRSLPFAPIFWQHLRLPEPPPTPTAKEGE